VSRFSGFRTGIEIRCIGRLPAIRRRRVTSQFDPRRGPLTIVPHTGTGWEHQPVFLRSLEPS